MGSRMDELRNHKISLPSQKGSELFYFLGQIDEKSRLWKQLVRIGFPLMLPCLALGLQVLLQDHVRSQKFLFFYPAVMLCGWISGFRGAIFATLCSAFEVYIFLLEPDRLTPTLSHDELIPLIVFICIGFLVSHYLSVEEKLVIALHRKTRELEAVNEARMSFLAHVSHEIRTPLNAILGFAQILFKEIRDPLQHSMVQKILTSGEYLLSLLNNILDFKRMEAHQIELDLKSLDILSLLKEIETTLMPLATTKGIALIFDYLDREKLPCIIDPLRFRQIFFNLLTNAIKFTEQGSVTCRMRILNEDETGCLTIFEIQDTGIGMNDATLNMLFKPFVQADATIAGRFGGSGLGLSIVKQLVEMMGGRIGVQSRPGQGSLFWLEIPLKFATVEVEVDAPSIDATGSKGFQLEGLRVLVADDNPINTELVDRILLREGARCVSVQNGQQVLNLLERDAKNLDVLLLDLHMPVMNGIEAARSVRLNPAWRHLPILAYTAENWEFMADSGLCDIFDGCIEKPIKVDNLIRTLIKFVDPEPSLAPKAKEDAKRVGPDFVNPERFEALFGSNLALFMEVFEQFQIIFSSSLDRLKDALARRDHQEVSDLLHNLRGAAANLGLDALAKVSLRLEQEVKENWEDSVSSELLNEFERSFRTVMMGEPSPLLIDKALPMEVPPTEPTPVIVQFATLLSQSNLEALEMVDVLRPNLISFLGPSRAEQMIRNVYALRFENALKVLGQGSIEPLRVRRFEGDIGISES